MECLPSCTCLNAPASPCTGACPSGRLRWAQYYACMHHAQTPGAGPSNVPYGFVPYSVALPAPPTPNTPAALPTPDPATSNNKRKRDPKEPQPPRPPRVPKGTTEKTKRTRRKLANAQYTPARVVGTGPVEISSESEDDVAPTPTPIPLLPPSLAQSITATADFAKKRAGKNPDVPTSATASDIWYFMYSTDDPRQRSREEILVLRATPEWKNISKVKPRGKHIVCKLCANKTTDPVWRQWANVNGQTVTMRDHLSNSDDQHKKIYEAIVEVEKLKRHDKTTSSSHPLYEGIENQPFTLDTYLEYMVRWMVVDDQSVNVVESPEFRAFSVYGRGIKDKDFPHRDKIVAIISRFFIRDRAELWKELRAALGRLSYTNDIWSDPNLASFMAMTVHYLLRVNGRLVLRSRLFAFHRIYGEHSGINLGNTTFDLLEEAGVLSKTGTFTLDAAGNCNTMLRQVEYRCRTRPKPVAFSEDGNHVRCFGHVVNTANKTILKELKDNPMEILNSTAPVEPGYLQSYYEALVADPLAIARGIISFCRSSGNRREMLAYIIERGNTTNAWGGRTLAVLQLLRDCETRWTSTVSMAGRLIYLYEPVQFFMLNETVRGREDPVKVKGLLFKGQEWQALVDIHHILEGPLKIQELLSSYKTPTLCVVLPAFTKIIEKWRELQAEIPELSYYLEVGIDKIREYIALGRKSKIYGLAMIINPGSKMEWINENWTAEEALETRTWMIDAMAEYALADIESKEVSHTTTPLAQSRAQGNITRGLAGFDGVSTRRRLVSIPSAPLSLSGTVPLRSSSSMDDSFPPSPVSTQSSFTPPSAPIRTLTQEEIDAVSRRMRVQARDIATRELDEYISEPCREQDPVFYWDSNENHFKYAYKVALDILPVQATSIPCESVFSGSKETCTMRRNQLSPELLEMLQVLKYLYRQQRMDSALDFTSEWISREDDYSLDGPLTETAIRELMKDGKMDELAELIGSTPAPITAPTSGLTNNL